MKVTIANIFGSRFLVALYTCRHPYLRLDGISRVLFGTHGHFSDSLWLPHGTKDTMSYTVGMQVNIELVSRSDILICIILAMCCINSRSS